MGFTYLDIEPDDYCSYDYVAIYDGDVEDDRHLVGNRVCGTVPPDPISSASGSLLVRFVTDGSVRHPGFRAYFLSKECMSYFSNTFLTLHKSLVFLFNKDLV